MKPGAFVFFGMLLAFANPGLSVSPEALGTARSGPAPANHTSGLGAGSAPTAAQRAQLLSHYGRIPLSFEPNQGQTDGQVQYLARGVGYALFLTPDAAVLSLPAADPHSLNPRHGANNRKNTNAAIVRAQLVGACKAAAVQGEALLPGESNYFIGKDSKQWHTGIPQYGRVRYSGVYPGVDLVYYGNQQHLEYDFVVASGADPKAIRLAYRGARHLRIDRQGDLHVATTGGELVQHKPLVYQILDGQKHPVEGHFKLVRGKAQATEVAFALAAYDRSRALTIDPVLTLAYSTYLGGSVDAEGDSAVDAANAIAVDSSGNIYVAGSATSIDFPVTANAFQTVSGSSSANAYGANDAFIAKINPAANSLIYSTYLGGLGDDYASGLAVDSSGNAYVAGSTNSTNFPTTSGAYQFSYGSGKSTKFSDAFITKLNPTGSALVYSTYLGGDGFDSANALAVDSNSNVYVAGGTTSDNFPVLNPPQNITTAVRGKAPGAVVAKPYHASNPSDNAFVTAINPTGSALIYSTSLGGGTATAAYGIAVDGSGDAYVAGATESGNFPVFDPLPSQSDLNGVQNAFVFEIVAGGGKLIYSTYLGGSGSDGANAIAVDSGGNAYVAGETTSTDFPVTPGAYQTTLGSADGNAFVAEINPGGSALVYSTYLGGSFSGQSGSSVDAANAIAVDGSGDVYAAGETTSANFPVTSGAYQTTVGSTEGNAFITEFNPTGSALLYSTYLGGSGSPSGGDAANAIAVDSSGNIYVAGSTTSSDFPTANPYQATLPQSADSANGVENAFISELSPPPPPSVTISANFTAVAVGQSTTLTWSSTNATSCTASGAWSGTEPIAGTQTVMANAVGANTYTLTCNGSGGSISNAVTVTAAAASAPPVPVVNISANPLVIGQGQSSTLTWTSTNAVSCTASGAWSGPQPTSGSLSVAPSATGNNSYVLTCSNASGQGYCSAGVIVTAQGGGTGSGSEGGSGGEGGGSGSGGSFEPWSLLYLSALGLARRRRRAKRQEGIRLH